MRTTRILKLVTASIATVTVAVAVALFGLQGHANAAADTPTFPSGTTTAPTSSTTTAPTSSTTTTVRPTTTTLPFTTVVPPATVAPPPAATAGTTLHPGDNGPAVLALQERLWSLGYWLGTPDGAYGDLTAQAVTAFQKVEGLERDGIAGANTDAALSTASRPTPASVGGDLIEVDKARQVLFVVRGGAVAWVLNVSTGTEEPYWIDGRTEMADTPPGQWTVTWVYDGVDVGDLGALYRPRYFHPDGIAVHGSSDVPPYPASHGCVRVTNAAIDWIWAENFMPIGSAVWVY